MFGNVYRNYIKINVYSASKIDLNEIHFKSIKSIIRKTSHNFNKY